MSGDRQLMAFLLEKRSPAVEVTGVTTTHQHLLVRRTSFTSLGACLDLLFAKLTRGGNILSGPLALQPVLCLGKLLPKEIALLDVI